MVADRARRARGSEQQRHPLLREWQTTTFTARTFGLRKAFEAGGVEFAAGEKGVRTRGSAVSIAREQVKAARTLLGWSQSELAKQVGLTETVLRHIEGGVGCAPVLSLSVIRKNFEAARVETPTLALD
jgi:DNA-binding XRE family transcriptional regulator